MSVYRFFGHLVNQSPTTSPVKRRVEAWDAEGICTELVAFAISDERGAFTMALDEEYLQRLFEDRSPTLTFRVYSIGESVHLLTTRPFLWKLDAESTTGRIEVGSSAGLSNGLTLLQLNQHAKSVVRGTLRSAAGEPLGGMKIKFFDRTLASEDPETELGTYVRTNSAGEYHFTYVALDPETGRIAPDLVVRAYGEDDAVIAESPRICQAPATAIVDLVIGGVLRGRTELQALQARIAPHQMDLELASATDEQLEHLSCASQSNAAHVSALKTAGALATATGAPLEAHYGMIREGLPATKRELLRLPPRELRRGLQNALARNTVSLPDGTTLDDVMDQLRSAALDEAFVVPTNATGCVGNLAATVLGATPARTFLDKFLTREGTIEEFWEDLPTAMPGVTSGDVANLQLAFQLGAATRFHFPLIAELQDMKASSEITSLRDLAKYDEARWVELLETERSGEAIGFPHGTPGEDEDGEPDPALQKANYAKVLRTTMARAFPTAAIAGDLERAAPSGETDSVATFIDAHTSFEFGKTRVAHYLASNSVAFSEGDTTPTRLRQIELLHKLTPRYTEMKVLIDAGLHSARDIVRMGRTKFVATHATALGGEAVAKQLFGNAERVTTHALAIHSKYGASTNRKGAYAVPNRVTPKSGEQAPEAADWAELFGSPDFCECEHCNSVYGPAAYFVDLLEFLDKHESNVEEGGSMPTAKDVLLQKRKDLAHIDLTCDNTLVALPYVDLVNEILEHAVWDPDADFPEHIATEGATKDLRALPEAIEPTAKTEAYETLSEAKYPWTLPFDLGATEARVYLSHLGVPRDQLMRTLQRVTPGEPDPTYTPSAEEIAAEQLGLSSSEREIITGASAVPVEQLWGLASSADLPTLKNVSTFLQRSGWSFDELRQLLDTAFMARFGTLTLSPEGSCDIAEMTIAGIPTYAEDDAWEIIHRFGRLQRRLGYSIREMDQAVTAFQPNIDDNLLVSLAAVERLRARFGLPVPVVLSWFADIDTWRHDESSPPSFYEQVFQNKAVLNPPDSALSPAALSGSTIFVTEKADALSAALHISAAELAMLSNINAAQAAVGENPAVASGSTLSIRSLSILYRFVSFARALGLSVRELLMIDKLAGKPLTGPAVSSGNGSFQPADVDAFVETVDRIRRSGFRTAELLQIFANFPEPATPTTPDAIDATLKALFAKLVEIYRTQLQASDPTGDRLRALLGNFEFLGAEGVEIVMAFVTERVVPGGGDPVAFFGELAGLAWNPDALRDRLCADPTSEADDIAERCTMAYVHFSIKTLGLFHTVQALSAAVGLDATTTQTLLSDILTSATDVPLIEVFSLPASVSDPYPTPSTARDNYLHLERAATIIRRLQLTRDEVKACKVTSGGSGPPIILFDFDALPRSGDPTASDLFAAWQTLFEVTEVRSSMAIDSRDLASYLKQSGEEGSIDLLSHCLPWAKPDIEDLASESSGMNLSFGGPVNNAHSLLRLRDAFAVMNRLGVSAETALGWASPAVASDTPKAIIQVAKSKHTDEEWATVAPPLRDVVREKQRNALVAYLMNERDYTDPDQLFADLYIDVQMSPCQLTSRIKQGIGSIQTFVQRALLDLEPGAKLTEQAAREWSWRKSYRVWEANRKIFLYPENWVYPELRDDKSPFFKKLESELRQKDITDEIAEDAFARYLESLEQVAHLTVRAMYHEIVPSNGESEPIDVLHVIGRTNPEPHKYFYRRRVDSSYWTPWEPIDLDIEGDHLVLSVIDSRPHIFWPVIEKKADSQQKLGNKDKGGGTAKKYLEIRLAWSVYQNKSWSARRISNADITLSPSLDPGRLTFVLGGSNRVVCLLDPSYWRPVERKLFHVGTFRLDVCQNQMIVNDRHLDFPQPAKLFDAAMALKEKAQRALEEDEEEGTKLLEEANKKLGAAYAASTKLVEALDTATAKAISLTQPALSEKVFQDDKQMLETDAVAAELPLEDIDTLTLPILLTNGPKSATILGHTPLRFRVLVAHDIGFGTKDVFNEIGQFFYKDRYRTFFAEIAPRPFIWTNASNAFPSMPSGTVVTEVNGSGLGFGSGSGGSGSSDVETWAAQPAEESLFGSDFAPKGYRFWTFYHPYACTFLQYLKRGGVEGLLSWQTQASPQEAPPQFYNNDSFSAYLPNSQYVNDPKPMDDVDFSHAGAYSAYNWEVFFHIPFLVATRLMQNQRFEEARKWFHYIFDPTSGGTAKSPQRFWKVRPFFENDDLATIQEELAAAVSTNGAKELQGILQGDDAQEREEFDAQVAAWQKNPFNPHAIARLRPLAYQKAVVMKYIENLIAWGDQLFRRDTLESINEATQLYILASQLLGPRPVGVRGTTEPDAKTYALIEALDMGPFSDPLVSVESLVGKPSQWASKLLISEPPKRAVPAPDLKMLLFCVPPDEMLLGLWDTVADRLFKVRHCMNIEGVVRQLPLFEPPIDPALLVRAAAAGVDLASALDGTNPLLQHYRFSVMHAKAMELTSSVAALGGAFLSALEKKDAEHLSRLRSGQEIDMLSAVREVKEEQAHEAREALKGLQKALEVATVKRDYYAALPRVSAGEAAALAANGASLVLGVVAEGVGAAASPGYQGPNWSFGAAGWAASPVNFLTYGGANVGSSLEASARRIATSAALVREAAAMTATTAGYDRRWEEWKFQERLANKEIQQIEKQIIAAEVRVAILEKELENHELQMRHAREVGDHLRGKFTNEELYDWMVDELSTVFSASYQLAYDMAKRAEKAYRFERAVEKSSYIKFGYWDNLKKGLLAGERLQHDLRQLEVAYLEQNAREYEITKHVSLASLSPAALMELRDTGSCTFELAEALFDLDYPGHYLRRLKSVSVTIPALSGPYTGVNCALRLSASSVRTTAQSPSPYARNTEADDGRFADNYIPVTSTIVTSSAQNDGGVFELNFRDERYLPFEGAGAISTWKMSLPRATNGFDVSMVSDVIVHVRYTAREGGSALATNAKAAALHTSPDMPHRFRLVSLKTEFPDAWAQFMSPQPGEPQTLSFEIDGATLPFLFGQQVIKTKNVSLFALWNGRRVGSELVPKWYSENTDKLLVTLKKNGSALAPSPLSDPGSPTDLRAELKEGAVTLATGTESNFGHATFPMSDASPVGAWTVSASNADIEALSAGFRTSVGDDVRLDDSLQDIWFLIEYTQDVPTWA